MGPNLDSLLEPTGPLRESQQLASKAYGSRHTYFVTNGTSTANKIITQAVVAPGDIVLLVTDITTPGNASASFESTVSVAGQVQQTSASNLSTMTYQFLIDPQS